jgi:hypothetical protein
LLQAALRNRGIARILSDEMESGILDLDKSEAFAPLDAEARNYRAWAYLYLDAKTYWGVRWDRVVAPLAQLYLLAPNFKDTTTLYYQAALNYARQLAAAGDNCGAAEYYTTAEQLFTDPNVASAQATAQFNCSTLTPQATELSAPTATPMPTLPISATPAPFTATPSATIGATPSATLEATATATATETPVTPTP